MRTTQRLALLLAAAAAPTISAQTGPFQDGEIIVHSTPGGSKLLRVDPFTGASAVLITATYWGGWADSLEYDPYRGALIASMSLPPDPYWKYRLWAVDPDGGAVALPGVEAETIHGIAPVGDGRLYFQRRFHGNTTIEYYDAANTLHVLMDGTGAAPATVAVEHMLYDAATNALIATSSPSWSVGGCGASPPENTLYRIPLSVDGSQLAAPVQCSSLQLSSQVCVGLDQLPGGRVLATFTGNDKDKLWSIDPLTLGAVLWSEVDHADLNGGLFSSHLNRAVVYDDVANELRTYSAGQGGDGLLLPVSMAFGDGTTGWSPASWMTDINLLGPSCQGYAAPHGVGLAGKGGLVPTLGALGCPDIGQTDSVVFGQVVGSATGVLFVGTGTLSAPFKGGTFYVAGLAFTTGLIVGGTPGVAGAGQLNIPVTLTDPAFIGFEIVLQAGFHDTAAVSNVSLSNALRLKGF